MTGRICGDLPIRHMDTLERFNGAYTIEDVRAMLEYKRDEWADSDMSKHFHPSTLYKPELFNKYMGQMLDARDSSGESVDDKPMHREIRQIGDGWKQYDENTDSWHPINL